ncbi:MAG TPA: alkaline phosphatase family protein, partial [Sphingomicrobium sp.]|nr:alkaline phosphatase family protein [Sphingomicrobium sp.]
MIRALVLAVVALYSSPLAAQAPPPPKLLVVISVDQLSSDLFNEYRPQFSAGLDRIASGALFRNGSSREPQGQSLGELMKARWPDSRNVAVAGRSGLDPIAGGASDQHWFWAGTKFQSALADARVPGVVLKVNAAVAAALSQPRPPLDAPPFCQSRERKSQLARAAGDALALAASPELDGDTLALAAGLIDEMQLGRRANPDVLAIDLSATGNVARSYGAASEEMCMQLTELDREIGDFLSLLDARGIDYSVALHG